MPAGNICFFSHATSFPFILIFFVNNAFLIHEVYTQGKLFFPISTILIKNPCKSPFHILSINDSTPVHRVLSRWWCAKNSKLFKIEKKGSRVKALWAVMIWCFAPCSCRLNKRRRRIIECSWIVKASQQHREESSWALYVPATAHTHPGTTGKEKGDDDDKAVISQLA